jgi:hypothetical protein
VNDEQVNVTMGYNVCVVRDRALVSVIKRKANSSESFLELILYAISLSHCVAIVNWINWLHCANRVSN